MNMKENVYQNKIIEAINTCDLEFLTNEYLNSSSCDVDELIDIKYEFVNGKWYSFIIYKI